MKSVLHNVGIREYTATVWRLQKSLTLPQSSLQSPTDMEGCTINPESGSHVCWLECAKHLCMCCPCLVCFMQPMQSGVTSVTGMTSIHLLLILKVTSRCLQALLTDEWHIRYTSHFSTTVSCFLEVVLLISSSVFGGASSYS